MRMEPRMTDQQKILMLEYKVRVALEREQQLLAALNECRALLALPEIQITKVAQHDR